MSWWWLYLLLLPAVLLMLQAVYVETREWAGRVHFTPAGFARGAGRGLLFVLMASGLPAIAGVVLLAGVLWFLSWFVAAGN